MNRLRSLSVLATALFLVACGGGGGGSGPTAPPVSGCSIEEQNQFVFDLMNDIYYWIDDVAPVANTGFASPEDVLEAFRFEPLDRFSGIRDREENDAFFSESQFIGVGVGLKVVDDTRVRITQAFADGPAAAAGLERGNEITAINGRAVSDILDAGESLSAQFGDDEIGVVTTLDYLDNAGNALQVMLAKDLVTIETVTLASEFDVAGRTVGYLAFRNFVEPSFEALEGAFAQFTAAGVDTLVLDLRYNGGGLISVAEFLGGLIGGTVTDGQIFANRVHNASNTDLDVLTRFNDEANALDLDELVIIGTAATASASELIINGFFPFADVTLVGEATFGKPVGAYQYNFCDKVAVPTAFANLNADGNGDYFDGFAPDCAAEDDLDRALGDPLEASLAEALHFVENGACSAAAARAKHNNEIRRDKRRQQLAQRSEMRQLINAY